jgi:hypothetical protein
MRLRTGVFAVATAALLTGTAYAQSAPRADVFAGYSLLPGDPIDDFPRVTASHGFQASAIVHLTRWFGLGAELGMQFGTHADLGPNFAGQVAKTRVTELFAMPRFTARGARADFFVHGLFGIGSGDAGDDFSGFSDSALAFGGGAGVDVHLGSRMSVRAQYDLFGAFADIIDGNSRLAVGLAYRFGAR